MVHDKPHSSDSAHTTPAVASTQELSLPLFDAQTLRHILQPGRHSSSFAMSCIRAYTQSGGLAGCNPTIFRDTHDISPTIAQRVIPGLIKELGGAGIVMNGVTPFDAYVGIFPSPLFMRAVLHDRSIVKCVDETERRGLEMLSAALTEVSPRVVEQRWLHALGSTFLCVGPGESLNASDFMKSLPELEGKEKWVPALLAALHEKEVITLSGERGAAQIFLSESFFAELRDEALSERIRDRARKAEPFPFEARMSREVEKLTSTAQGRECANEEAAKAKGATATEKPPHKPIFPGLVAPPTRDLQGDAEGNKAGREVRNRILDVFKTADTVSMGVLVTALSDLDLTSANLRYHVSLLCDNGLLVRSGKGRGAIISRVPTS